MALRSDKEKGERVKDEELDDTKQRIVEASERSKTFLEDIRVHPDDFGEVHDNLRSFVLYRFFLIDDDPQTEDVEELAHMSIEKLAEINKRGMLQDLSNNCTGVSSETMKKALLIMTLQKSLGVTFDPEKNETLPQMATAIVGQLGQGGGGD